jgi:hypothetical protein
VVQAAIPAGVARDREALLLEMLDEAVAEAERYALRKQLADGLPEIRQLVLQLHRHLDPDDPSATAW